MLKLREYEIAQKRIHVNDRGGTTGGSHTYKHLKSLRFEEISRDGDRVVVMVVENGPFTLPVPSYCQGSCTPIRVAKNDLVGAEYTFNKNILIEANDPPKARPKKAPFSQQLKEVFDRWDAGNLSDSQALEEIRTIFNAEV